MKPGSGVLFVALTGMGMLTGVRQAGKPNVLRAMEGLARLVVNQDQLEGKWKQFKRELTQKWAEFTDDDLRLIGGRIDMLEGKIQERYGEAILNRLIPMSHSQRSYAMKRRALPVLFLCMSLVIVGGVALPSMATAAEDKGLFEQMDIGLLSIGGRATYVDPKDGSSRWFGGGQVRLHPSRYLAFEGSVDYRRNDIGDTRVHSYPVMVSALIYPLGTTRLAPFLLGGGGWYYTTVKGPGGFDDTQNRFGAHAGGGLQFFFNKHVSIDSTYRYIWLEKIESRDQNIVDKKFQDNGHMVTVGINFHF